MRRGASSWQPRSSLIGTYRLRRSVTTFGTAVDLTAAEVSVEAFLPADESTAQWLTARSPVANPGLPAG